MYSIKTDTIEVSAETEHEARKQFRAAKRRESAEYWQRRFNESQAQLVAKSRAFWVWDRMSEGRIPRTWTIVSPGDGSAVKWERLASDVLTIHVHDIVDTMEGGEIPRPKDSKYVSHFGDVGWHCRSIPAVLESASGAPLILWIEAIDGEIQPFAIACVRGSVELVRMPASVTVDSIRILRDPVNAD